MDDTTTETDDGGKFAVFDTAELRFVDDENGNGVHTKAKALRLAGRLKTADKEAGRNPREYEVRPV